jgi:hypothetical protein
MTSLMSLLAFTDLDIYLTGNNEIISFCKYNYRRYTNFDINSLICSDETCSISQDNKLKDNKLNEIDTSNRSGENDVIKYSLDNMTQNTFETTYTDSIYSQRNYNKQIKKIVESYSKTCEINCQPDDPRLSHYDIIIPTNSDKGNFIVHTFAYSDGSEPINYLTMYYENEGECNNLFEIDFSKFYKHYPRYSVSSLGNDVPKKDFSIEEFQKTFKECEDALIKFGILENNFKQ